jgi:hypothetical protein
MFELLLVLLGITHFSAMLWLIVARHERENGENETWYDAWNMEDATWFEVLVDSTFWAT